MKLFTVASVKSWRSGDTVTSEDSDDSNKSSAEQLLSQTKN